MVTVLSIVDKIKKDAAIEDIEISSLESYKFIQQEFNKSDVSLNEKFQTRYMIFYKLYGAGLTKEFREEYFEIMQEKKNKEFLDQNDIKDIIFRLYEVKSAKGFNCIYFSFTTKLIHTLNNNLPIYDSRIRDFFGFRVPYLYLGRDVRVNEYLKQYEIINDVYGNIIKNSLLEELIEEFKKVFLGFKISDVKILDFMIWSLKK
jgi:hypothetical protein